jgi:hypothetical protein
VAALGLSALKPDRPASKSSIVATETPRAQQPLAPAQAVSESEASAVTTARNSTEEPPQIAPPAASRESDLRGPTLAALDSGRSVAWEAGRERGYVTVSEAVAVGSQTCRNIGYTASAPAAAQPGTWCRGPNADWTHHP